MTSGQPPVSVAIPTYNGGLFLREAIESVLNQSWRDFELVVCDDASSDNTLDVVRSFHDPRLRLFTNNTRLGLAPNWNRCLELCHGQYVVVFHQDDVMLPDNLARKKDVLDRDAGVGWVYSRAQYVDGLGRPLTAEQCYAVEGEPEDRRTEGRRAFESMLLRLDNPVCCPSVMFRARCAEAAGNFDESLPFTTDLEFWMRLSLFGDVQYLAEPLIKYRWHGGNESVRFPIWRGLEESYRARKLVVQKCRERIEQPERLIRQVRRLYGNEALRRAEREYLRHNYRPARSGFLFAARRSPSLMLRKSIWPSLIGSFLPSKLINAYRRRRAKP